MGLERNGKYRCQGREKQNFALSLLPHVGSRQPGTAHGPHEVHFHLPFFVLFADKFHRAANAHTGAAHQHRDVPLLFDHMGQCGFYLLLTGYITRIKPDIGCLPLVAAEIIDRIAFVF